MYRSKEFRQTDEHITTMHQDLKEDISKISTQNFQNLKADLGRMSDRNYLDEQATLEKAEGHMKNGNFTLAYEFFSQLVTEYPRRSSGWYGFYRVQTKDFTQVEQYTKFLCDGNYIDSQEEKEQIQFVGNKNVKMALSCEDADAPRIKREVTQFIRKCAEYGKRNMEDKLRGCVDQLKETKLKMEYNYRPMTEEENKKTIRSSPVYH